MDDFPIPPEDTPPSPGEPETVYIGKPATPLPRQMSVKRTWFFIGLKSIVVGLLIWIYGQEDILSGAEFFALIGGLWIPLLIILERELLSLNKRYISRSIIDNILTGILVALVFGILLYTPFSSSFQRTYKNYFDYKSSLVRVEDLNKLIQDQEDAYKSSLTQSSMDTLRSMQQERDTLLTRYCTNPVPKLFDNTTRGTYCDPNYITKRESQGLEVPLQELPKPTPPLEETDFYKEVLSTLTYEYMNEQCAKGVIILPPDSNVVAYSKGDLTSCNTRDSNSESPIVTATSKDPQLDCSIKISRHHSLPRNSKGERCKVEGTQ